MIRVQEIKKSFDQIEALKKVSFEINEGEIFGFLRPNGAGKSTTINIISTLLDADAGEVLIDGVDLFKNKESCKKKIGVVPQEISLYEDLSAYDNLLFWGSLYNIPRSMLTKRVDEVLKTVGLFDRRKDDVKTYSGGMKRRINIASSILHQPKILLLDEPTVGVDPQSRNHIFEVIEELNHSGMTILYTTHYMEEVERLCNQIAIIDNGVIVAKGTQEELKDESNSNDMISIKARSIDSNKLKILKESCPLEITHSENEIRFSCNEIGTDIAKIIQYVENSGIVIEGLVTEKANLEAIFLELTGKQLRD